MSSTKTRVSKVKTKKENDSNSPNRWVTGGFNLLSTSVTTIGIPGTVLIFLMYVIQTYSSDKQKSEFFDMWFLLKSESVCKSGVVYSAIFSVLVLVAQGYFYEKRRRLDKKEIDRLSDSRSEDQEKVLGPLHHS